MSLLVASHPSYAAHDTGRSHPERPARLEAVLAGIDDVGAGDGLRWFEPREATTAELLRVHAPRLIGLVDEVAAAGGGHLTLDTPISGASARAARLAAGAALEAVERLDAGEADAAFCAVRPPGHHATPDAAMGFCLFNNAAVVSASLADRGERVLVVDYDAHHGNGTQDAFYDDARVGYVSFHEHPQYPGTGMLDETGIGEGAGTTLNLPFPSGTAGDTYRAAVDRVVVPFAESFAPTWVVLSAGFDGHRRDPLCGLGLTAADYWDLTDRLCRLAPAGRRVVLLEGGYDLAGLRASVGAAVGALLGVSFRPEASSAGEVGLEVVAAAEAALSSGR